MEKLGIYGGTFDPPHLGHRAAAEHFFAEVGLDRLLIIPDYLPPHKEMSGKVTSEDRLAMCRLNFSGIPSLEVSDLEILRGGRSYTYETIEALSAPDRELYFLVGTDMYLYFHNWKNPERILDHAVLVCMRRENDPIREEAIAAQQAFLHEKFGAETRILNAKALEVSSTGIREAICAGEEPSLLSPAVFSYIRERGLYR